MRVVAQILWCSYHIASQHHVWCLLHTLLSTDVCGMWERTTVGNSDRSSASAPVSAFTSTAQTRRKASLSASPWKRQEEMNECWKGVQLTWRFNSLGSTVDSFALSVVYNVWLEQRFPTYGQWRYCRWASRSHSPKIHFTFKKKQSHEIETSNHIS